MEQLFTQCTDESHAITGAELIEILGSMGIKAERKTIYDDIATLRDTGLDIQTVKSGHSNAYYMGARLFDDEELKIIADSVAACRFISPKRSRELITKLQSLTSRHKAPSLRRSVHIEHRADTSGENIYSVIDGVEEAVFSDRQIEVLIRSCSGEKPVLTALSPYELVWENEQYYIICRLADDPDIIKLRAGRLNLSKVLNIPRVPLSETDAADIKSLKTSRSEHGKPEHIKLNFDPSIIDEVENSFDTKAISTEIDGSCTAEISTHLSDRFWGWLLCHADKAKIISPEYAVDLAYERAGAFTAAYC